MVQSIMYMCLLTFTFTFMKLTHPLTMGLILLIQTFLICLITGYMNENFWFSYILFLVFLGGMLVLFIYVTSLVSNEMFNFSFKLSIMTLAIIVTMMMINSITYNNEYYINNCNNNEMIKYLFNSPTKESMKSIYKLYNFPTNLITLLLINYLFFTLIVTVKITNLFYGPLRNLM